MQFSIVLPVVLLSILFQGCFAPPVTKNNNSNGADKNGGDEDGLADYMEYHRYLKEVVQALESDDDFRKKLENAEEDEIRSGKIADQLEFVSHHVRTRLDEIKRAEMDRLRELVEKKRNLSMNDVQNEVFGDNEYPRHHQEDNNGDKDGHHHLDHSNPHTFEIEDLKRLIAKTTEDLAEADRKRREEFKQYELQKEFEKQKKLNDTSGDEKEKLEKHYQEQEDKRKKHEKLHEPGHKKQLEAVWEEQDHMQQEFNPRTFFMLHDLDSNNLWDQDEVKALFIKELDKMYAAGAPESDMRERVEEMERMRESVFQEVDTNRDGFIDYNEFLAQTRRNDFQQDHGWQGLDERKPYTDEELNEYIRQQQAYYHQYGYPPHGAPVYPGQHQGQMPPMQQHPGQMQQHPGQMQQHPGQMQQQHPGQMQQQQHPGQMQQQQHPGQMQQQQHPGQMQQQQHPGQMQQQQHPGQMQQQQHPGQIQQQHPGQMQQQNQYGGQNPGQVPPAQPPHVNQQQNYAQHPAAGMKPNQMNQQYNPQGQQQPPVPSFDGSSNQIPQQYNPQAQGVMRNNVPIQEKNEHPNIQANQVHHQNFQPNQVNPGQMNQPPNQFQQNNFGQDQYQNNVGQQGAKPVIQEHAGVKP